MNLKLPDPEQPKLTKKTTPPPKPVRKTVPTKKYFWFLFLLQLFSNCINLNDECVYCRREDEFMNRGKCRIWFANCKHLDVCMRLLPSSLSFCDSFQQFLKSYRLKINQNIKFCILPIKMGSVFFFFFFLVFEPLPTKPELRSESYPNQFKKFCLTCHICQSAKPQWCYNDFSKKRWLILVLYIFFANVQ